MGPFELMDLVGIDMNLAAARGIYVAVRGPARTAAERFRPSPIQEWMVEPPASSGGRRAPASTDTTRSGRSVGPPPAFEVSEDAAAGDQ